ncbi:hypothetical protein [Streptomyces sp. A30]|uniref:hypothetical protein n=1 Tax=Streptomyces sp. A30 TaxID=2789273 RepID=UPI0039801C66
MTPGGLFAHDFADSFPEDIEIGFERLPGTFGKLFTGEPPGASWCGPTARRPTMAGGVKAVMRAFVDALNAKDTQHMASLLAAVTPVS